MSVLRIIKGFWKYTKTKIKQKTKTKTIKHKKDIQICHAHNFNNHGEQSLKFLLNYYIRFSNLVHKCLFFSNRWLISFKRSVMVHKTPHRESLSQHTFFFSRSGKHGCVVICFPTFHKHLILFGGSYLIFYLLILDIQRKLWRKNCWWD